MVKLQWMTACVCVTHAALMVYGIIVMLKPVDFYLTETLHVECLTMQNHILSFGYMSTVVAGAGIVTYAFGLQQGRFYLRLPYFIAAISLIVFGLLTTTKINIVHQQDMNICDKFWLNTVRDYINNTGQVHFTFILDAFQKENDCCGYNGYEDYQTLTKISPPRECCKTDREGCNSNDIININTEGCSSVIRNFYEDSARKQASFGYSVIGLGLLALYSIILGPVLPRFHRWLSGLEFCKKKTKKETENEDDTKE